MAHQTSTAEKAQEQVRRRSEWNVPEVETGEVTDATARLGVGGNDLSTQVAALQRLGGAQRVALMRNIGRVQGNQHTQHLVTACRQSQVGQGHGGLTVQARMSVSEPGDEYEQEADQVAERVMRMSEPALPPDEGDESSSTGVHRSLSTSTAGGMQVAPEVETRIERMRGGGRPLPTSEREFFEPRLGVDLSGVRVHTDGEAVQTARELSARAYTVGSDIAFNAGEYEPGTDRGRRLLAHELAHVVQQGGAARKVGRRDVVSRLPSSQPQFGAADPKGQIAGLHPVMQAKVQALIENAHKKGLNIWVHQGMRTVEEQNELYAQGRTKKGNIVTQVKGGDSYHNYGVAVDIVFYGGKGPWAEEHDWNALGAAGREAGLEWGGDWKSFVDRPHFQLPGLKIGQLKAWLAEGGMSNVWKHINEMNQTTEPATSPSTVSTDNSNEKPQDHVSVVVSPTQTENDGKSQVQSTPETVVTHPTTDRVDGDERPVVQQDKIQKDQVAVPTRPIPMAEVSSVDKDDARSEGDPTDHQGHKEARADLQMDVITPEGEMARSALGNIIASINETQTVEQDKGEIKSREVQQEVSAGDEIQVFEQAGQAEAGLREIQGELAQHQKGEFKFEAGSENQVSDSPEALLAAMGVDIGPIEEKKRQDRELSESIIDQFIAECSAQAGSLAAMAENISARLQPTLQQARRTVQTSVERTNRAVRTAIEQARAKAKTDAEMARTEIETKYTATVTAIQTATQAARTNIETDYTTKLAELVNIETTKAGEIAALIANGERAVHAAASQMAQSARAIGAQYVARYQAESYPQPSILEGSDYYERKRQAKINVAQQVSEQYAAEFESKGQELGGQVAGAAADVNSELTAKIESARQAIESERTAALAELEQFTQDALAQAQDTQTAQLQAVDTALQSTQESLAQLENNLLSQVAQTGAQQIRSLEQAAQQAQASLQQSVQESVSSLNEAISGLETQLRGIPALQPAELEQFLAQARAQFNGLYSQSVASLETQISTSGERLTQSATQAAQSLGEFGQQAASQADEITTNLATNVAGLTQSAVEAFSKLETDHTTAVKERVAQTTGNFDAALTQARQDADKITGCLQKGLDGFVADFENSLRPSLQQLPGKIEQEAAQAADKVQPAWKKAVAFIATVVITVVVAVAIGALVASGVGLGLGLLLAAGIGALGGIAKGMINNWAEGEPITKDLLKNAVMGALDGMLQFVGGRFVKGLKLPDTGWKQVLIKKAVDTVSGVITDMANLAWDGKLNWESAGKTLLNNLVRGLVSFGTGTMLDKWKLPDGSFKKYLAESGMGTIGDTITKMTQTFLIEGEPFTFEKALSILGESGAENFLSNAVQAGFDKAKVEDKLKDKFDGWFGNRPGVILDPKTGQPFGYKPEKAIILDADGNPIRPNTPLAKLQEVYENLGKWARGETTKPYVLGPDGHPVDSKGKPIKVQSEAPEVGLYGPDGKPLLDTNGKPYKKPNEPGVGLYGPDGKPLLDTNGNSISDKTRNARQDDDLIPTLVAGIVAGQDKSDIAHTPEVVTQTPRTDSRSTGAQMAERLGYPEPPKGYHWARHGDDVILKRNPGMAESLPRLEYDPASGKFLDVGARARIVAKYGDRAKKILAVLDSLDPKVPREAALERLEKAYAFYLKQGFSAEKIPSHLKGIDFSQPVKVTTLPKGTVLEQWQVPGGNQGNYYALPGTTPTELGISPVGQASTGEIVNKVAIRYVVTTEKIEVLRSTAAAVKDTWSVPGTEFSADGGGIQFFSTDKGSFRPLGE